jgi:hypothetical protein
MAGPVALKPNRKSPIYLREYGSLRSQGQTPAQAMGIADRRFVRKMVKLARIQTVKEREQIGARDAAMFLKRKRALGNIRKALEKALGQLRDKYPSARGRVSEMEARIVESVIGDATVDAQQRTGTAPQVDLRKWVAGYAVMRTGLLKIRGDLSGQIRSSPSRNEIRRMAVDISDALIPGYRKSGREVADWVNFHFARMPLRVLDLYDFGKRALREMPSGGPSKLAKPIQRQLLQIALEECLTRDQFKLRRQLRQIIQNPPEDLLDEAHRAFKDRRFVEAVLERRIQELAVRRLAGPFVVQMISGYRESSIPEIVPSHLRARALPMVQVNKLVSELLEDPNNRKFVTEQFTHYIS